MDNRLKEIVDNFDSLKIGVDEPFRFHCTMCGKCCINREDILLTPRDIYCMAKELQISPEELFIVLFPGAPSDRIPAPCAGHG